MVFLVAMWFIGKRDKPAPTANNRTAVASHVVASDEAIVADEIGDEPIDGGYCRRGRRRRPSPLTRRRSPDEVNEENTHVVAKRRARGLRSAMRCRYGGDSRRRRLQQARRPRRAQPPKRAQDARGRSLGLPATPKPSSRISSTRPVQRALPSSRRSPDERGPRLQRSGQPRLEGACGPVLAGRCACPGHA